MGFRHFIYQSFLIIEKLHFPSRYPIRIDRLAFQHVLVAMKEESCACGALLQHRVESACQFLDFTELREKNTARRPGQAQNIQR